MAAAAAASLVLLGSHHQPKHSAKPSPPPTVAASAYPPVQVSPVPRTSAADKYCPELLAKMPITVDGQQRRRADNGSQYFLAWGAPPIIVRCGVPRPKKFVVGKQTYDLSPPHGKAIRWFEEGPLWTAVDRSVYVSVLVPDGGDTTSDLMQIGKTIEQVLPAVPIRPGPAS